MKAIRERFKKGTAVALTAALLAGLMPALPGAAGSVKAAGGTTKSPSVSVYATKKQLMDDTFKPGADGTATNYGKLVFGKNSSDEAQEWYILGTDKGVSVDNTILFATSPIAQEQEFNSSDAQKTDSNLWSDCNYGGVSVTEVFANHYGASNLRGELKTMAENTSYFTAAEQGLMNDTTVITKDTKNNVTYTTTDKLYALAADGAGSKYKTIKAGSDNSTVLAMSNYWDSGYHFWLRTPYVGYDGRNALLTQMGEYINCLNVSLDRAVQPASNLDLSSVLFASAATAASSDTAVAKTIASGAAMTLRFDGTGKNIGTVTYNATTGAIKAVKDSTSQPVSLVVQGNDGTNDWYYSKQITGAETVNASEIKSALSMTSDIDLSACKIWLEITEDNVSYAVNAEKENERHVHCVCGTSGCKLSGNTHKDVTWTPVSDLNEIKTAGNYYLTQDIEMKETWEPKAGVVLCLNGHSISNTYKNSLYREEKATIQIIGKKFTLTDCSRDENGQNKGSVTHAKGSYGTGVTFFNTDTMFDMYGGNIRENDAVDHHPKWNGAGVYVSSSKCHFTMYGGSISDNQGHGVSVVEGATFTMNGGSITNNTISGSSGAGVVNCGKVVMNKGLISKNSITNGSGRGAGVHNGPAVLNANYQKPVFEMQGGEISENTTTTKGSGGGISNLDAICTITSGSICRNQAKSGGGVDNLDSVFNMRGGEIIGNRANNLSGGGVNNSTGSATATGSFTMSGGVIKENQAAQYGGGVACYEYTTTTGKGVLTISVKNAAVIQNNTLENNKSSNLGLRDNVVLTDVQLKGSNQIGISTETAPKTEKPITIANKTGLMNGLFSDHAAYEIAEEDGKTILQMKKYTVKLVLPEDGSVSKISGGDLVQKVNDNFQAVQLQADDDHYFSEENKSAMRQADIWVSSTSGNVSTITIYVRPTADVEVQILATEKASQEAPGNISGIAPTQEGGKGYLKGVDAKMEYREKGTDTWITCQDNSLGQEVTAGKTYEVRKKGDITKKDSPIIEVFVPNKENVTPNPEPNPNPNPGPTPNPEPNPGPTPNPEPNPEPEPNPNPTPAPTPEKPVMKDGDNGQYTEGKMETLTFRSSAPLSDFRAVYVDGVIVDSSHYELASGSTIVRLRKEFLDSLAEGIHTLEIRSTGGTATANFTVVKATGSGSDTGSGTGVGTTPSAPTAGITNVQPNGGAQAAQKTTVNAKAPVTGETSPVSCVVLALIIVGGFALLIAELRKAHKA